MTNKDEFLAQCFVLDTETTGQDVSTCDIVENGYALYIQDKWVSFSSLIYTDKVIEPEVACIINITNKMIEDAPQFVDHLDEYQSVVNEYLDGYFVAHNYTFDRDVLEKHGAKLGKGKWICTYRLSKKLLGDDPDVKNLKLQYLRHKCDLPIDPTLPAHRAGNDALITGELLSYFVDLMVQRKLIDPTKPIGEQVYEYLWLPIIYTTMPLGKYKGKLLEEVPIDYWQWAIANMDILNESHENYDADFAASVSLTLEKILA